MTRVIRSRAEDESGVVLIIFTVAMIVLLGIIAIAIDGSYGFVQNRRAQNAADFAAFAAAQQLNNSTYCNGTTTPSTAQITGIIQQLVNDNGSGIGTNWTAQFLDSAGDPIANSTFSPSSASTDPPPGSCGVSVDASPAWKPFFAGIFGINQLKGNASGKVGIKAQGQPLGILALNKVGPHEILGGGTGTFVVSGNIFLNTDVTHQPWTGSDYGLEWDDAIDAKTNSNLYVYGTIDTVDTLFNGENLWPLDTCFQGSGIKGDSSTPSQTPENPAYQAGDPAPSHLPGNDIACSDWGSSVTVDYNGIYNGASQINDPLLDPDAPQSPLVDPDTAAACPGMTAQTYSNVAPTQTTLLPGIYTTPVELTGSVNFADCSGYPHENAYPGVYVFENGLFLNPQSASDTVTGSNIVIATQNPYPMAGNVPGTVNAQGKFSAPAGSAGDGAPCLPAGTMTSAPSGHGTPESEVSSTQCAGSSNYGVVAYGDSTFVPATLTGTGSNFSLIVGGVAGAQVNLTGPTTGAYGGADNAVGLVLYQDPNTQGNYGFDAETGDGADINVTGVVYDSSLQSYGANAPLDYWDGVGGGIPFYQGGTLQTGFGAGWATGDGPTESSGSFTLNGTAVVDDFNTDGATTITILGKPYSLPGGGALSLIG